MPFLSDYLNFNGTPGTPGPQGPQGFQGDPATSIIFKGHDTWDNISALPAPEVGDGWFLTDPAGAPDSPYGPAEQGDLVIWNGSEWVNVGPIEGPQGPQGFQGERGYGFAFKGTATWAYVAQLTAMILNDLWILVDADPNAPPIDDPDIGPLRPAMIGDAVAWTGTDWENLGPFRGPEGPQGFQGFQGNDGADGAQGDPGVSDTPGPQGPQGVDGDPAQSIIIKGNDTWANISALPSPVQNEAWFLTEATGAPPSPYGPAGVGDIVIYDGVSAWTNGGPLQGPQGDTGPQGQTGAQGVTGAAGSDGSDGAQGQPGAQGAKGAQGNTGITGAEGPQGDDGAQGATGQTGAQGERGSTGPRGDDGPQGSPGIKGDTGAQGSPGLKGDSGAQGPQGPQGLGVDPDELVTSPAGPIEINSGFASMSMSGVTATGQVTYLTVGAYVFVSGRLSWNSAGTSSTVQISGLPFASDYNTGYHPSYKGIKMGSSPTAGRTVHGRVSAGSTTITLHKLGEDGSEATLVGNNCEAGGHININLCYLSTAAFNFYNGETP